MFWAVGLASPIHSFIQNIHCAKNIGTVIIERTTFDVALPIVKIIAY